MAIETRFGIDQSVNCDYVERRGAFKSGAMVATIAAFAAIAALPGYARGMNFFIDVTNLDYTEAHFG